MTKVDILSSEIKNLNDAYRQGNPLITDKEYDILMDNLKYLDPNNELFNHGVIETVSGERKEKLKYPMYSLDKETTIGEIHKWLNNKNVPLSSNVIVTAKYDGISILKNEKNGLSWTRGDGVNGETIHKHYKKLNEKNSKIEFYTIGEMIIPKHVFLTHVFYRDNGEPFKNARNMIAGLKNSDTISDDLKYANHVRYGIADEDYSMNKSEQLEFLAKELSPIPYKIFKASELNVKILDELYFEWGKEYDIDGLVIDIDDKDIRKKLGREKNNNPAYSRAFKNTEWSTKNITKCKGIEWNISKLGYLKPVCLLDPFNVDGVTVSRATGYNAKFIIENSVGEQAYLNIIRSGFVIPKIIGVEKIGKVDLPTHCPSCDEELSWNETNVDLICTNKDCGEIKFQKLAFFFVRFKITGFAEKTIKKFYDAGYDTVGKILSMSLIQIQSLEGMGNLSATKLLKEFDEKVKQAPFYILGHASTCFENIGSRKLKMIIDGIKESTKTGTHFEAFKRTIERMDLVLIVNMLQFLEVRNEIIECLNNIKGMSNKTSESFLNGLVCFEKFMKDLDVQISDEPKTKKEQPKNNNSNMKKIDLTGREFVFTGFRDQNLKDLIESSNGVVKDGITKNTTDLLTKNEDSTSAKALKAKSIGAKVTQVDVFKESLK